MPVNDRCTHKDTDNGTASEERFHKWCDITCLIEKFAEHHKKQERTYHSSRKCTQHTADDYDKRDDNKPLYFKSRDTDLT